MTKPNLYLSISLLTNSLLGILGIYLIYTGLELNNPGPVFAGLGIEFLYVITTLWILFSHR